MKKHRTFPPSKAILAIIGLILFSRGTAVALPYSHNNRPLLEPSMSTDLRLDRNQQTNSFGTSSFPLSGRDIPLPRERWGAPFWGSAVGRIDSDGDLEWTIRNLISEAIWKNELPINLLWRRVSQQTDSHPTPVPEPASLFLLGAGLLSFTWVCRKHSRHLSSN